MTIDYSRQGKASRRKGANAENEVRDLLREHGWATAHRNFMSGGSGGGDLADAIPDYHLEVKRTERLDLNGAWKQSEASRRPTDTILLCHRGNMQPWLGTVLFSTILELGRFAWSPQAIGQRQSVRAEIMSRLRVHSHPLIVHTVAAECVCTALLADVLLLIPTTEPRLG